MASIEERIEAKIEETIEQMQITINEQYLRISELKEKCALQEEIIASSTETIQAQRDELIRQEQRLSTASIECCCPAALRCAKHRPKQHRPVVADTTARVPSSSNRGIKVLSNDEMAQMQKHAKKRPITLVHGDVLHRPAEVADPQPTTETTEVVDPQPTTETTEVADPQPTTETTEVADPQPTTETTEVVDPQPTTDDLSSMTLQQLKQVCRERHIRGFSKHKRKSDLILYMSQTM